MHMHTNNYRSILGKRPLPGKHPHPTFQGVNVAASIQTYGILIPGKRPCGPKSQVMFKKCPWALTRDTMVLLLKHTSTLKQMVEISQTLPLTANNNSKCPTAIPFEEFEKNPNTLLIATSRGGHFGYLEGLWPTKETWMNRLNRQLLEAFKTL